MIILLLFPSWLHARMVWMGKIYRERRLKKNRNNNCFFHNRQEHEKERETDNNKKGGTLTQKKLLNKISAIDSLKFWKLF